MCITALLPLCFPTLAQPLPLLGLICIFLNRGQVGCLISCGFLLLLFPKVRSQVLDPPGFGTKACGLLFLRFSAVPSIAQPSLDMLNSPVHTVQLLALEA